MLGLKPSNSLGSPSALGPRGQAERRQHVHLMKHRPLVVNGQDAYGSSAARKALEVIQGHSQEVGKD
jgi:hypothetical protein